VTRVLPVDEWPKVAHLDVATWLPYVAPEDARIIVVEDGDRIVGAWGVFRVVHCEGIWIDPAYRRSVVHASLIDAATAAAAQWAPWAFTGAATAAIGRLIRRYLHGQRVPMETYAFGVKGASCLQR